MVMSRDYLPGLPPFFGLLDLFDQGARQIAPLDRRDGLVAENERDHERPRAGDEKNRFRYLCRVFRLQPDLAP